MEVKGSSLIEEERKTRIVWSSIQAKMSVMPDADRESVKKERKWKCVD